MPDEPKLPVPEHPEPKTSSEESETSVVTIGGGTIHPIRTSTTIHGGLGRYVETSPSSDDSDHRATDAQRAELQEIRDSAVAGVGAVGSGPPTAAASPSLSLSSNNSEHGHDDDPKTEGSPKGHLSSDADNESGPEDRTAKDIVKRKRKQDSQAHSDQTETPKDGGQKRA